MIYFTFLTKILLSSCLHNAIKTDKLAQGQLSYTMNVRKTTKKRFVIIATVAILFLFIVFSILGFATQRVVLLLTSPHHIIEKSGFDIIADTETVKEIQNEDSMIKKACVVEQGDTLLNLLKAHHVETNHAYALISALKKEYDPRNIKPGQEITILYDHQPDDEETMIFRGVSLRIDAVSDIMIMRNDLNNYDIKKTQRRIIIQYARSDGIIQSSLYEAALQAGLPLTVLMEMVRLFSFDVDFQRDVHPNDQFEVMYEQHFDDKVELITNGPLLYASLTLQNTALSVYRHATLDGETDYFDENGRTVRKTLLKTPIDGARLTSRYGMRRHPIKGYSEMHKGLDFAAPTGTPIMASGDGTIVEAGRKGSYGNYIRIRHANQYLTAYAHLSAYARGLKKGKRIKQGDIIGYVGATGMATGPHLHYEVLYRGRQINPAKVKFPPGRILAGKERELFLTSKQKLDKVFADLGTGTFIAKGR